MKYRIIAMDLDGTLTNSKKEVSDRTCRALWRYQEQGGCIVLASGRPTYGVRPVAERLRMKSAGGPAKICETERTVHTDLPRRLYLHGDARRTLYTGGTVYHQDEDPEGERFC